MWYFTSHIFCLLSAVLLIEQTAVDVVTQNIASIFSCGDSHRIIWKFVILAIRTAESFGHNSTWFTQQSNKPHRKVIYVTWNCTKKLVCRNLYPIWEYLFARFFFFRYHWNVDADMRILSIIREKSYAEFNYFTHQNRKGAYLFPNKTTLLNESNISSTCLYCRSQFDCAYSGTLTSFYNHINEKKRRIPITVNKLNSNMYIYAKMSASPP